MRAASAAAASRTFRGRRDARSSGRRSSARWARGTSAHSTCSSSRGVKSGTAPHTRRALAGFGGKRGHPSSTNAPCARARCCTRGLRAGRSAATRRSRAAWASRAARARRSSGFRSRSRRARCATARLVAGHDIGERAEPWHVVGAEKSQRPRGAGCCTVTGPPLAQLADEASVAARDWSTSDEPRPPARRSPRACRGAGAGRGRRAGRGGARCPSRRR